MASSKERERQLARERYERRLRRAQEKRMRAKRTGVVVATVIAVLAVIGGVAALFAFSKNAKPASSAGSSKSASPSASASASASPSASASASAAAGPCMYTKSGQASRNVGVPPATPARQVVGARIALTSGGKAAGTLSATLDGTKAPCTVNSFTYLAAHRYFDGVPCHRLTTAGIYVLQCGDPSGSGSGGPGYEFKDENLGSLGVPPGQQTTYPAGTLAMANAGPGTNGSQFFIVYKDSPLAASYTPFGKVTKGLDAVKKIAAKGTADGSGDGKPKNGVTMTTVTILR